MSGTGGNRSAIGLDETPETSKADETSGWDDEDITVLDPSVELETESFGYGIEEQRQEDTATTIQTVETSSEQSSSQVVLEQPRDGNSQAGIDSSPISKSTTDQYVHGSSDAEISGTVPSEKSVQSEQDNHDQGSHQVVDVKSVGTETSDLILTITRSSSTEESAIHPTEVQGTVLMTTSISTVSDGSEEERFVKVKPSDFEFESSKGSSQSGKDNLEFEEQIMALSSQCDALRSEVAEKENNYLKVKLELESLLLEKNVEGDAFSKATQQLAKVKEELFRKEEEVIDLRSNVEETKQAFESYEIVLSSQENRPPNLEPRSLLEMVKYLIQLSQKGQSMPNTATGMEITSDSFSTIELENDMKQTELESLRLELKEKANTVEDLEKKCKQLESLLYSTNCELEDLKERESDVIGGYQSVSSNLEKAQLEILELKNELDGKSLAIQSYDTTNGQLKREIERFKEELISKDEDLGVLQINIDQLNSTLKANENASASKISALEKKNSSLQGLLQNYANTDVTENSLREMRETLAAKSYELEESNSKFQIIVQELESEKLRSEELKVKYEKLEEKFKKAIVTIKQKNLQLSQLKEAELRTKSPESGCAPSAPAEMVSELQSEVLNLQNQLSEKDQSLNEIKIDIKNVEGVNRNLEKQNTTLRNEVEEITMQLKSCEGQLTECMDALGEKNGHIEQLMKHTAGLQEFLTRETEELSSAISVKDEEIRKAIQQYEEYYQYSQEKINQLSYTLQTQVAESCSVKEEFTELEKELQSAQRQLADLTRLLQNSEQVQQQLTSNLEECNLLLDEKKSEIQSIANERNVLEEKVEELLGDLKKKNAYVNQLDEILSVKIEALNLLEFSVNECKASIYENNQVISELKQQLADQNNELEESHRKEHDALAYKESYRELVQLKSEHRQLQLQLADSETRFQQMAIEYERKASEIEILKDSEVFGCRNELSQILDERDSLAKGLQERQEIILRLQNEKSSLLDNSRLQETERNDNENSVKLLQEELSIKQDRITCLENESSNLREQMKSLETKYNEMQSMLQELSSKTAESASQDFKLNDTANPNVDLLKTLEEEKVERQSLERKVELLQSKIYEIEISEMKSFEECLMLKSWMREVELENIKYSEELQRFQSAKDGEDPKLRTLQNEVIRLIQALEDRDKRTTQLTMEITRLLEERDSLQLKLSSALKHNVSLNGRLSSEVEGSTELTPSIYDKEHLEKKLAELEEINYSMNVDLKREKEARRLVQEQLLFSQTSKFYRDRSQPTLKLSVPPKTLQGQDTSIPGKQINTTIQSVPLEPVTIAAAGASLSQSVPALQ